MTTRGPPAGVLSQLTHTDALHVLRGSTGGGEDSGRLDAGIAAGMAERMSPQDLEAQSGTALPDKEALSLLNVNADLDLALDLAAPIDAAIAANANAAVPIDAAVSTNILSTDSSSTAIADQDGVITQNLTGTAEATATQTADLAQGEPTEAGAEAAAIGDVVPPLPDPSDVGGLLDGGLLDLNVDLALDADIAAPVDAAIAANANIAAPVDAAVSANILSSNSDSAAVADQSVIIEQNLDADAIADATQDASIEQ